MHAPKSNAVSPAGQTLGRASLPWLGSLLLAGTVLGLRSAETPGPAPDPNRPPVGSIVAFAGPAAAVPESGGWMWCDGRVLPALEYPALHATLGTAWGSGEAPGTFRLPDLRGRFLRGANYDATGPGRDPDPEAREPSAPGANAGNEVGSLQADAVGPHIHPLSGTPDATGQGSGAEWVRFHAMKVPDTDAPAVSSTWAVRSNDGAETRPRNVGVNWIIRVR